MTLTIRETEALRLRLSTDPPMTYTRIGAALGVTGVRARQLVMEAERKLRVLDDRRMAEEAV